MLLFQRTQFWFQAPTGWQITICNPCYRHPMTSSHTSHAHSNLKYLQLYMQTTDIHEVKRNLEKEKVKPIFYFPAVCICIHIFNSTFDWLLVNYSAILFITIKVIKFNSVFLLFQRREDLLYPRLALNLQTDQIAEYDPEMFLPSIFWVYRCAGLLKPVCFYFVFLSFQEIKVRAS